MNDFDIILINVIVFMTGFGSGLGFCFKYKNRLLSRSRSQEFQNNQLPPITQPYPTAPMPMALGYPDSPQRKEIVIRTTE